LNWKPIWDFDTTIEKTINWYKNPKNESALERIENDIKSYFGWK
jgi:dTDP-D-glucose 4,6-dehydratase